MALTFVPNRRLLTHALALGVAGDILLRGAAPGLSFLVWVGGLALAWVAQRSESGLREDGLRTGEWWMLGLVVAFASVPTWRDSGPLRFINFMTVLVVAALLPLATREGRLKRLEPLEGVVALVTAGLSLALGPLPHLATPAERVGRAGRSHLVAVAKGLVIAIPLLLVFGGLLGSADAGFERLIMPLLQFDLVTVLSHLFLILVFLWIAAGFLAQTRLRFQPPALPDGNGLGLGTIETGMVFGSLNALFGAFVVLQAPYLFGGGSVVEAAGGPSYAEYARRGFFELVTAAALVLPLLLLGRAALRREDPTAERTFRLGGAVMIALVFVMMLSAAQRMVLYQGEFGLTALRFYASCFMAWLAVSLGWFAVTVLRGRSAGFLFGIFLAWVVGLGTLDVANPSGIIARVNLRRGEAGQSIDTQYLAGLGADAVPALLEALPRMADGRSDLTERLHTWRDYQESRSTDWRNWNLARARAVAAIRAYEASH